MIRKSTALILCLFLLVGLYGLSLIHISEPTGIR